MLPQVDCRYVRVSQLVDGGDWACSYGQCGTLVHVCRQLAAIVDDQQLAEKACVVAREAQLDLDRASRSWSELAASLRHRR